MAPTHGSRPSSIAPGAARHKAQLQANKPSYKVVLEEVTEKKKKLLTLLSFNTTAPRGYTFIPAGDPQLTNRCKKFARDDGANVFIVSASKQRNVSNLSHEVHRVGYHFPSTIVDKACISLGVTLSSSGTILQSRYRSPSIRQISTKPHLAKAQRKTRNKKNAPASEALAPRSDESQATIDTDALQAIRDLFPNIPEKDLYTIVRHAFEKGHTRVGMADLPLTRRATLAVVAHIRHNYTDYDKLLRIGSWEQARKAVEHLTLDKLMQWRVDKDDNADAMSDILREVIVIDDDDSEDEQDADKLGMRSRSHDQQRDSSVEVISSQAGADMLQTWQLSRRDLEEQDPEVFTTTKESGSYIYGQRPQRAQRRLDRSDTRRRQAWLDAQSRRRQVPAATLGRPHPDPRRSPRLHVQPYPSLPIKKDTLTDQIIDLTTDRSAQQFDVQSERPSYDPYRRETLRNRHGRSSNLLPLDNHSHSGALESRNIVARRQNYGEHYDPQPPPGLLEQILPSVESPITNQSRRKPFLNGHSGSQNSVDHRQNDPVRPYIVDLDVDAAYSPGKRRRLADVEPLGASRHHVSSKGVLPERTVLVPLDQFREGHCGNLPSYDPRHSGYVTKSTHEENIRPFAVERSAWPVQKSDESVGTAGYGLPVKTAVVTQLQPRPHLQVQLTPRDLPTRGHSPLNTVPAKSEYDQTVRSSHSHRPLLAPVPIDLPMSSERDYDLYSTEDRERRLECAVPVKILSSPHRTLDCHGFSAMPDRREYPRYPDVQTENRWGKQVQLPGRHRNPAMAVLSRRPEELSPRAQAAFPEDPRFYQEPRAGAYQLPHHLSSISHGDIHHPTGSVSHDLGDPWYDTLGAGQSTISPTCNHTNEMGPSDHGMAASTHNGRVRHSHDDEPYIAIPQHLSTIPELHGAQTYHDLANPGYGESWRDVVILD